MAEINENVLELDAIMADGYGIVSRKVMRAEFISVNAKSFYSYLCSFAGSGNQCFPSTETIKRELNMCKDTFYRTRKELEAYGIIEIITSATRKGMRTVYHLCSDVRITPDAAHEYQKTLAVRESKAKKIEKAKASVSTESQCQETKVKDERIYDAPQGFKELEAISLKKVRSEEYAETVEAYENAIRKGYTPEDIRKAYEAYLARYKQEHSNTIRYAKQLKAYLTDADGIVFDAGSPKKSRNALIVKNQDEIEQQRRQRADQEAHEALLETNERYRELSEKFHSTLPQGYEVKDKEAFEQWKRESDAILDEMNAMKEEFLVEATKRDEGDFR